MRLAGSEWKWSFLAYTAIAAGILVQFALLVFLFGWVTPCVAEEFAMQGRSLPNHLLRIIAVADFFFSNQLMTLVLVILGLFLFEWKYRGECKPTIRIAGGAALCLILMVVTSVVSITHTVCHIQVVDLRIGRRLNDAAVEFGQRRVHHEIVPSVFHQRSHLFDVGRVEANRLDLVHLDILRDFPGALHIDIAERQLPYVLRLAEHPADDVALCSGADDQNLTLHDRSPLAGESRPTNWHAP